MTVVRIEHTALWTKDIENSKEFFVKYFGGTASDKYINTKTNFQSYFISFECGARLEIMQMICKENESANDSYVYRGFSHIAFSVGSSESVDNLTNILRNAGYMVVSEPRWTGDGYYESCVLDPDGNRIEITK